MSQRIVSGREPGQEFLDNDRRGSSLEMCDEPCCSEWAQSADPTEENTLKFKCPAHEAQARARGQTGKRQETFKPRIEYGTRGPVDEAQRALSLARIKEEQAARAAAGGIEATQSAAPAPLVIKSRKETPMPRNKTKALEATNGTQRKTWLYLSEAAAEFGIKRFSIDYAMANDRPHPNGWTFKWIPRDGSNRPAPPTPKQRKARSVETVVVDLSQPAQHPVGVYPAPAIVPAPGPASASTIMQAIAQGLRGVEFRDIRLQFTAGDIHVDLVVGPARPSSALER